MSQPFSGSRPQRERFSPPYPASAAWQPSDQTGKESWSQTKANSPRRQPEQHVRPPYGVGHGHDHKARQEDFHSDIRRCSWSSAPDTGSDSDQSMLLNPENATPPDVSPLGQPSPVGASGINRLSLDDERPATKRRSFGHEPRTFGSAPPKRGAPVDVYGADGPPPKQPHRSPRQGKPGNSRLKTRSPRRKSSNSRLAGPPGTFQQSNQSQGLPLPRSDGEAMRAMHSQSVELSSPQEDMVGASGNVVKLEGSETHGVKSLGSRSALNPAVHAQSIPELDVKVNEDHVASGRENIANAASGASSAGKSKQNTGFCKPSQQQWQAGMQKSSKSAYSMILQPESSPISEQQLAAEIKGIYDGLVTVETKCIDIDAALAHDSKSQLGVEQWQALIALHRTLLYEHHDFLMASQHPSATEELKGLAVKYSMPARMWKHGIHAFLEVLRHRRPDSQDYMLAFVVLAYQMMALLFETVPCFTDTWIECLGDLARYRMAIEDDREMHAVWGGVAARWYTLASDRHPEIGRLYHHLGILERPSMRKLASYAKSVTCSIPFLNARDSMATFCKPIVQEEHLSKSNIGSAEALLVTVFALIFLAQEARLVEATASNALQVLAQQPSTKTKDFGPQLVLSLISSVFEFGSAHNILWDSFSMAISEEHRSTRPSEIALPGSTHSHGTPELATTSAIPQVLDLYFAIFNTLVRPQHSTQSTNDLLSSVHVILAWFHSLHSLGARSHRQSTRDTINTLMDPSRFSWGALCDFLNGLCHDMPIDESVWEAGRQDGFPRPRAGEELVPLAEDYWMRGLLWAQLYLPKDLLPDRTDEIESSKSGDARVRRVQWLALSMSFRDGFIKFDISTKTFQARFPGPQPAQVARVDSIASTATQSNFAPSRTTTWGATATSTVPTSPTSTSRSSTLSVAENSDEFTEIRRQKAKPKTYANVAAAGRKKSKIEDRTVRIADTTYEVE